VFRRRKQGDESADSQELEGTEELEDDLDQPDDAEDDGDDGDEDELPGLSERPDGPWDESEVGPEDTPRIDLGSLRILGVDGMELRVDMDEPSGQIVGVTAVLGESAVQIQPFAAPRSEGIWDDVRAEMRKQINASRGMLSETPGPFGTELRTQVGAQAPDGTQGTQPARFVGIDGPRWMLRAVYLGASATDPAAAGALDDVVKGTVVVRGNEAMAPGDPLPLSLPEDAVADDAPEGDDAPWTDGDLDPFERGPEITEIR
jgi:hypothetical protein